MNKRILLLVLSAFLYTPFFSAHAGWFDWLPWVQSANERITKDSGQQLTEYTRNKIEALREKAKLKQRTAIQIGEISSSIYRTEVDKRWFGDLAVTVKADYSATYGLPYDLIEKGIRIEKDRTTTGLVVVVSAPILLSAPAVDTKTIRVENRDRNGVRTWGGVSGLIVDATRWLTEVATADANKRCRSVEALEMTRFVVRDIVLDMVGELYSRKIKRELAPRITVIFENELNQNDFKRRTGALVSDH